MDEIVWRVKSDGAFVGKLVKDGMVYSYTMVYRPEDLIDLEHPDDLVLLWMDQIEDWIREHSSQESQAL